MNAVDSHAHVFARNLKPVPDARYVPDYDATVDDWIALQNANGVTHGVLVQPSFLGTDNAFLLAALGAHPRRLRGVVVAGITLTAQAIAAWDALGVRGIRLNVVGLRDLPDFAAADWKALFARIADRAWHVEVHASGNQMAKVLGALAGCPAALVFDHFGLPDPERGVACPNTATIARLAEQQLVYVKLSAPYRLNGGDAAQYARFWLAQLGAERLLWGSDWPWTNFERAADYAGCVGALSAWIPEAADRRRILWDTPRALFRF